MCRGYEGVDDAPHVSGSAMVVPCAAAQAPMACQIQWMIRHGSHRLLPQATCNLSEHQKREIVSLKRVYLHRIGPCMVRPLGNGDGTNPPVADF